MNDSVFNIVQTGGIMLSVLISTIAIFLSNRTSKSQEVRSDKTIDVLRRTLQADLMSHAFSASINIRLREIDDEKKKSIALAYYAQVYTLSLIDELPNTFKKPLQAEIRDFLKDQTVRNLYEHNKDKYTSEFQEFVSNARSA